jgi:DNA-binding LytR/AlgR family response regulator
MKGIHIFMILHLVFYNQLLNTMYSEERFVVIFMVIQAIAIGYLSLVIFFSARIYITYLPIFHSILLITLCYWMLLLARAAFSKKAEASLVLVGVVFFGSTAFIEILYVNNYAHNPRIVPIGLLMLVFSYIVVTTKAYANSNILVQNAESEKYKAIAQAHVEKAAFLAEKERSSMLHQTLTDSESISQVDRIRGNLRQISYIVSESGGTIVCGDQGERLFDMDLTLKKISEIFGTNNQLIRCSKAYIVNPSKARKVIRNNRRYELQFINSTIENIPVGNKYLAEVRNSIQIN